MSNYKYNGNLSPEDYLSGLIDNNPINNLLPVTSKNDQGINFDVWAEVLKSKGYYSEIKPYQHKIYSQDGYREETRMQLILIDKIQRITSYISAYGLTVYEAEQYNQTSNEWYIVGDSSLSKDLIIALIEHHNLMILQSNQ